MKSGNCKQLKIYLSENATYRGHSLYHSIVLKAREYGLAGATVLRGIEGFGKGNHLHSARLVEVVFELPIVIEIIDEEEKIMAFLPTVQGLVEEGLITLNDIHVVKYGNVTFE